MPTPADMQTDRPPAPFELDDPTDPQNLEAVAIRDSDKNITPPPAPTVDTLLKGMDDEPPKSRAKPRASPRAFAAGQKSEAHEAVAPPAPYKPADEAAPVLINQTAPLGTRLPQTFAEDARETVRNAPRRPSPDTLNRIFVRGKDGQMVQLSNIVSAKVTVAPRDLRRFNQLRAITIEASLAPGYTLGEAIAAVNQAAAEVLSSGCRVTALGLDVTHQVRATEARIAAIEASPGEGARTAAALLRFSQAIERRIVGWDAAPLHDPCTVAWLLQPDLFRLVPCAIAVETGSDLTRGHTAVEFRVEAGTARHGWGVEADGQGVFDLITRRLGTLP
jgi:hypothetical protein